MHKLPPRSHGDESTVTGLSSTWQVVNACLENVEEQNTGLAVGFCQAVCYIFIRQTAPEFLGNLVFLNALSDGEDVCLKAEVLCVGLEVVDIGEEGVVVGDGDALEVIHSVATQLFEKFPDKVEAAEGLLESDGLCSAATVADSVNLLGGPVEDRGGLGELVHEEDDVATHRHEVGGGLFVTCISNSN